MKKLRVAMAIFTFVIIASCKKEGPAAITCSTVCKNGGTVNSGCGCNCPLGFTGISCETPVSAVSACELNHTATVVFKNQSVNNYTYTIYWDNVPLISLTSGQIKSYPTASNVQRKIYAVVTTTSGAIRSSTQTVTFKDCSTNTFTWTF